jgi:DDE superfamily endonuclease
VPLFSGCSQLSPRYRTACGIANFEPRSKIESGQRLVNGTDQLSSDWFPAATRPAPSTPGRRRARAARAHSIVQACLARQILVLADRAYQGAGATFRTPYYHHHEQPTHYQQFNRDHARLRAPGERAFAQLKSWRLLRRARCSTRRISTAAQTIHTLLTCDYSG